MSELTYSTCFLLLWQDVALHLSWSYLLQFSLFCFLRVFSWMLLWLSRHYLLFLCLRCWLAVFKRYLYINPGSSLCCGSYCTYLPVSGRIWWLFLFSVHVTLKVQTVWNLRGFSPFSITKKVLLLLPYYTTYPSYVTLLYLCFDWLGREGFPLLILRPFSPFLIRRVPAISLLVITWEQDLLNLVLQVSWLAAASPHMQPGLSPPVPLWAFASAVCASLYALVQ